MKKKLLTAGVLLMAAVILVAATVYTTIAYLSASSAVSNTFTVGSVAIDMWETQVDQYGVPVGTAKVKTNSYHLVAGGEYTKDPTIEITSNFESDNMYLFVKSRNDIRNIEEANQKEPVAGAKLSMRQQMEANGWVQLLTSGDGKDIIWVYGKRLNDGTIVPTPVNKSIAQPRFDGTTGPAGQFQLCQYFKIEASLTDLSAHNSSMVDFKAFAIQTAGITSAKQGWEAIKDAYENVASIVDPQNPYDSDLKGEDAYKPVAKPSNP